MLAFLPGAGEIRRTETFLRERISDPAIDAVAPTARSKPRCRTAPSRPRHQAGGDRAGDLRSRRHRSPSKACESWSTPGLHACRATSRTWD